VGARQLAGVLGRRYPQINFEGIRWALYEKEAGFLAARRACADVVEGFSSEGGEYREASVVPPAILGGSLLDIRLTDGSTISADLFVFACGPWLPRLFPDPLAKVISSTRQEVF
jgi:glycine/D-amino acid oxidase-like deaminating enzyme